MNLSDYPAAIEAARIKTQRLTNDAERAREAMGEIDDQVTANVASALDENNKPLYSNETKRKAAIAADLKTHTTYQTQAALLTDTEIALKVAEAQLERLRGEFAVAKIERNTQIAEKMASCAVG